MIKLESLLLLVFMLILAHGLVHDLAIRDDDRSLFKIETFGFFEGGTMNIKVTDFHVNKRTLDKSPMRIGFIMQKSETESQAQEDLEKAIEEGACIIDDLGPDDLFLDLSLESSWHLSQASKVDGCRIISAFSISSCSSRSNAINKLIEWLINLKSEIITTTLLNRLYYLDDRTRSLRSLLFHLRAMCSERCQHSQFSHPC